MCSDTTQLLKYGAEPDARTGDDSERLVVAGIPESNAQAGYKGKTVDVLARDIQSDRDREEGTLSQTVGVHHAI